MAFFNSETQIVQRKQSAFEIQDMPGLWRVHWQRGRFTFISTFYTQHDQACLLWGMTSAVIFVAAQFLPISWTTQTIFASGLTLIGIIGMIRLSWHFVSIEKIRWILYIWVGLMLSGCVITDLSLFLGWGRLLMQICPLWLGLTAVGYLCTGVGMRSRTIMILGFVHLFAIALLPHVGMWQPLTSGLVIGLSSLLLAELQWDADGVCGYQSVTIQKNQELAACKDFSSVSKTEIRSNSC